MQQVYALGEGVHVEGCLGCHSGALHELSAGGVEEGEGAAQFGQFNHDLLVGGVGRNGQGGVVGCVDSCGIAPDA